MLKIARAERRAQHAPGLGLNGEAQRRSAGGSLPTAPPRPCGGAALRFAVQTKTLGNRGRLDLYELGFLVVEWRDPEPGSKPIGFMPDRLSVSAPLHSLDPLTDEIAGIGKPKVSTALQAFPHGSTHPKIHAARSRDYSVGPDPPQPPRRGCFAPLRPFG